MTSILDLVGPAQPAPNPMAAMAPQPPQNPFLQYVTSMSQNPLFMGSLGLLMQGESFAPVSPLKSFATGVTLANLNRRAEMDAEDREFRRMAARQKLAREQAERDRRGRIRAALAERAGQLVGDDTGPSGTRGLTRQDLVEAELAGLPISAGAYAATTPPEQWVEETRVNPATGQEYPVIRNVASGALRSAGPGGVNIINPPSGYQPAPGGGLMPTPGGPADPAQLGARKAGETDALRSGYRDDFSRLSQPFVTARARMLEAGGDVDLKAAFNAYGMGDQYRESLAQALARYRAAPNAVVESDIRAARTSIPNPADPRFETKLRVIYDEMGIPWPGADQPVGSRRTPVNVQGLVEKYRSK